jgi:hypothetical protein
MNGLSQVQIRGAGFGCCPLTVEMGESAQNSKQPARIRWGHAETPGMEAHLCRLIRVGVN